MEPTRSKLRRALWVLIPALALGALAIPRALAWGFHHHHHAENAEELGEHLTHGLDRLLDRVEATDAQKTRASAIAERRAPELFALMEEGRALRKQLKQALLAEQLDKALLDKTRLDLDALADKLSDVGLSTMAELAEVLTPAQRKRIADKLAKFEH